MFDVGPFSVGRSMFIFKIVSVQKRVISMVLSF